MNKALIILLFASYFGLSQTNSLTSKKISSPEKFWAVFHPFKLKKAKIITNEVLKTTDSISNIGTIDQEINGGQLDAFKHSYWMARLSQEIGIKAALKLGKAHEKGNYKSFLKGEKEDKTLPDFTSSQMDLFNNEIGAKTGKANKNVSNHDLINIILIKIKDGEMRVIKKDKKGNFLSCDDKIIPKDSLKGKWKNEKCLVPSNNYHSNNL